MAVTTNRSCKNSAKNTCAGKKTSRKKVWMILAVFAAIGISVLVYWIATPSRGDILAAGYTGTPEQDRAIREKLTGSFDLNNGMIGRLSTWNELRPTLVKMPAQKRQTILVNSVLEFTEKNAPGSGGAPR